jgi:hypothetical protein
MMGRRTPEVIREEDNIILERETAAYRRVG